MQFVRFVGIITKMCKAVKSHVQRNRWDEAPECLKPSSKDTKTNKRVPDCHLY